MSRVPFLPALGWVILAATALLGLGGAARHGDGLQWGLPGAAEAALALASIALLARGRFARGRLALGLAPVLVLALVAPQVPGARALAGAPLLALAAAAGVAVLGADWPGRLRHAFLPLVAVVYVAASVNVQLQVGAEGDEPHYLMVAESLLRDHDLALEPDYAEGRYRAFYRTQQTLAPHYLVRGREGEIYSQHALGLSLLVLPAYALGGYPAASLFMALLAVGLAWEMRALLRAWLGEGDAAELTAWSVALSAPLLPFVGLIFTEVPAALALAFALRRLRDPAALGARGAWAVGAVLACVPWLNVRYAPFPALLLAYALAARPGRRLSVGLVVPGLISALASALFHFQLYGFFDPRRVYGRRPGFAWSRLPDGLEALLFDQEFGLLPYAPLFVLVLPGLAFLLRSEGRRHVLALLAPVAVVLVTAATWRMWWGGWTPPARFLVPVVPALAVLVGWGLRRGVGAAASLLLGVSLCLGLATVGERQLVHRDRDGTAPLFRAVSGGEEWTRLLPAFVLPDADPRRRSLALIWGLTLAAGALAAGWPADRRQATARGLAVASLAFLAASGAASRVSTGRSLGRDAVRLIGRPAWDPATFTVTPVAEAEWGTTDLGWGPAYEAHRHPGGALIGGRLALPAGRYRLTVLGQTLSGTLPPELVVSRDARPPGSAGVPLVPTTEGWTAAFDVPADWPAADLRLRGGGPLVLAGLRLQLQP